jgi:adenosylcobinamide kinase/adenosylcobinamide-phosphate guanylyltransferase
MFGGVGMGQLTLLLGGARSGKSATAERMAQEHGGSVLYVATAQAFDDEMRERIAMHRAERPPHWQTLEAPLNLSYALFTIGNQHEVVLVDCMTLLASNALLTLPEEATQNEASKVVMSEVEGLLDIVNTWQAHFIVVSNEVGMGIVPPYRLGRLYRDALGRANQRLASVADEVMLLVAGLPWKLK